MAIKSVELARLNKKLKENLYGEIKILKTLRHPHIVALHDCVESATHINLIMEYCELGDLSLFIKKRDKLHTNLATKEIARKYPVTPNSGLNEVVTRHFLKQLASALKFLREGNFVHRDVKPQNLLLLPSPQFREANKTTKQVLSASHDSLMPIAGLASMPMLKLADFGFARVLPSTSLAETLCGSPLYMAPEILRYERYDAKADLWSVGTVLHEMVTGRPPFRASNHVELLRKIEAAEDQIRFPRESVVSTEMKSLIRALLKRNPVQRLSFENFFDHPVVTGPIPNLVDDDIPKEERRAPRDLRAAVKTDEPPPVRKSSFRRTPTDQDGGRDNAPLSPKPRRSSPLATPTEAKPNPLEQAQPSSMGYSPGREGLGIRHRPQPQPQQEQQQQPQPSTSAPTRPGYISERRHRASNASLKQPARENRSSASSDTEESSRGWTKTQSRASAGQTQAEQEVAFERDYVLVEKKHVEVNAFADEMAANRHPPPATSKQIVRRATQQGSPTSPTGAVPAIPSRNTQVAQGKIDHYRHPSYDKNVSGSPGSAKSYISRAIQDASLRLFGFKYSPHVLGKGTSPPQLYSPFPAYPTPSAPVGLIGDGKQSAPVDEDARVAQCVEEYATRSDVVYGFAEVKYKQLLPLTPSMDHGLGGIPADRVSSEDDLGLTVEAIVSLSEEALVLYVKALTLLAKSMDIASLWWSRKNRTEPTNGGLLSSARESSNIQTLSLRINSAVQWIRSRFNEVLEKAEVVRLKLVEAQRQLPEDHPSHPSNRTTTNSIGSASGEDVFLSPGISAEKLMYDRALEMSRAAAINEIANEDLPGCELSYVTAIRMLEAVLDNEDDISKRRVSSSAKDDRERAAMREASPSEMNSEDQQAVQKGTMMPPHLSSHLSGFSLCITGTNSRQSSKWSPEGLELCERSCT